MKVLDTNFENFEWISVELYVPYGIEEIPEWYGQDFAAEPMEK